MEKLSKNIVITGGSLSYNRYGYDTSENVWEYASDMGSRFKLRDLRRARGCEVAFTYKGGIAA